MDEPQTVLLRLLEQKTPASESGTGKNGIYSSRSSGTRPQREREFHLVAREVVGTSKFDKPRAATRKRSKSRLAIIACRDLLRVSAREKRARDILGKARPGIYYRDVRNREGR